MFAREADTQLRNIPGTPGRSTHILLPEFWDSIAFFFGFVSLCKREYPANPALLSNQKPSCPTLFAADAV